MINLNFRVGIDSFIDFVNIPISLFFIDFVICKLLEAFIFI